MSTLFAITLLLISIFVAWAGGNFFVKGVNAFQRLFRLSGLVAGLLIASISTSSPELFVGVSSAVRGLPEISLGDILGSNIVNIGLIFGIFLIFVQTTFSKQAIHTYDILITALTPIIVFILGFDGIFSKLDGIILLATFALWLRWVIKRQHGDIHEEHEKGDGSFLHFAIGLCMLVLAGYTFTHSAETLANAFGVNLFLLSTIIVALGTSMPELATSIIAIRTKQNGVAIGNILGSNIFNSLGILGLVALIEPIHIEREVLFIPILFTVILSITLFLTKKLPHRTVGYVLVSTYATYILFDAFLWK